MCSPCPNATAEDTQLECERTELGSGGVPKGAHTSDFYHCKDMPQRFDNPDWFKGYGAKQPHPMYRTTNAEYGSKAPTVHTMHTAYYTMSQEFTRDLGKCGMYRNSSLNCGTDKSIVPRY